MGAEYPFIVSPAFGLAHIRPGHHRSLARPGLEDAACGRIDEQVQTNGLGLLTDSSSAAWANRVVTLPVKPPLWTLSFWIIALSPNGEGLCSGSSRPKLTTNSRSAALSAVVALLGLRAGKTLSEAYHQALLFTGNVVVLTGVTLGIAVATWAFSPIRFQADMGILLGFMFIWNMLGALILLPALAHFLLAGQEGASSQSERTDPAPQQS